MNSCDYWVEIYIKDKNSARICSPSEGVVLIAIEHQTIGAVAGNRYRLYCRTRMVYGNTVSPTDSIHFLDNTSYYCVSSKYVLLTLYMSICKCTVPCKSSDTRYMLSPIGLANQSYLFDTKHVPWIRILRPCICRHRSQPEVTYSVVWGGESPEFCAIVGAVAFSIGQFDVSAMY